MKLNNIAKIITNNIIPFNLLNIFLCFIKLVIILIIKKIAVADIKIYIENTTILAQSGLYSLEHRSIGTGVKAETLSIKLIIHPLATKLDRHKH